MNKRGLKSGNFFPQLVVEEKTIEVVYFFPSHSGISSAVLIKIPRGERGYIFYQMKKNNIR